MDYSFSFENSGKPFSVLSRIYFQVHLATVIIFRVQGLSWPVDIFFCLWQYIFYGNRRLIFFTYVCLSRLSLVIRCYIHNQLFL